MLISSAVIIEYMKFIYIYSVVDLILILYIKQNICSFEKFYKKDNKLHVIRGFEEE